MQLYVSTLGVVVVGGWVVQCSYVYTWLHGDASLNTTHSPTSRCLLLERGRKCEESYLFKDSLNNNFVLSRVLLE